VDRSFRDLELPVVDAAADVSVDTGSVDLVPVDLAASELRDQHRRVHRSFLLGEIAEPLQESAPSSAGLVAFAGALRLPFSLSLAAAFFASVAACFFIAFLL
jgi:hypothetical protein